MAVYCSNIVTFNTLISIYLISLISHIVYLRGIIVEVKEMSQYARQNCLH